MSMNTKVSQNLRHAAELVAGADAILIGAGAGIGVDSGLPVFFGEQGFYKAYPLAERLGLTFSKLANPSLFKSDPRLAWGFYGHRFNLYRNASPHEGFGVLKKWSDAMAMGGFVYTSNVDGHFQKAGFSDSDVAECHGSILHWQCSDNCGEPIWQAPDLDLDVDEGTLQLVGDLPTCEGCGAIARPNVVMYGADSAWDLERSGEQIDLCDQWLAAAAEQNLVVIEIGAGADIPAVRNYCAGRGAVIGINPSKTIESENVINIGLGALDALQRLDALIGEP